MFRNTNNIGIFGGTFTDHHEQHQHQHQHSHGIYNTKKSAIDRLVEVSSLGALHNSGERFDPPKCHPNTRTAVLEKLMDWFIGFVGWDIFVLWLYGPAGAGKSAIAQTFAEQCSLTNGLLASFFFSRSDPKRNNEKALVATLAYQIALRIPGCWEILEPIIDRDPAIFQLNFETQFQTLILNPLLQLSTTGLFTSGKSLPYLFIIDGLDECIGSDVQRTILNTISNALQRHRFTLPFMFLIASRPEYHLAVPFNDVSLNNLTLRLALDDTYLPDKDIKLYLKDSFHDIRQTHIIRAHLPDSWPSGDDITKLVTKSSGQFIYAATVIRYVASPRHNPLNRLKVILGLLPVNNDKPYAQLDALYINILSGVEDIEETLYVLGFHLVQQHLNPVKDLELFMLLDPGRIQLLLLDLPSVVDASNNRENIKLLHASFGDFLFDPTRSLQFHINPNRIHEEAARICIKHINSYCNIDLNARAEEYMLMSVADAYIGLVYHLGRTGSLHDNFTLREEVLNISFVRSLRILNELDWDPFYQRFVHGGTLFAKFLDFLRTSDFWETKQLFLYHRGVWDQSMREDLSKVPASYGLAFWTAYLITLLYVPERFHLETIMALPSESSSPTPQTSLYVPYSFFLGETSTHTVTFDGLKHSITSRGRADDGWLDTDPDYLMLLSDFLTDPMRAGPHTANESTYILAAEFAVAFAVRPWDDKKKRIPTYVLGEWDLIWDAIISILPRAGYSNNLVDVLTRENLTFFLRKPETNTQETLRSIFRVVCDYLLQCTGSIPTGFKIGLEYAWWLHEQDVIYLDESIYTEDIYSIDTVPPL